MTEIARILFRLDRDQNKPLTSLAFAFTPTDPVTGQPLEGIYTICEFAGGYELLRNGDSHLPRQIVEAQLPQTLHDSYAMLTQEEYERQGLWGPYDHLKTKS